MVINKKSIRYTLLIILAIASTSISIQAMESEKQRTNRNKGNYVPTNQWQDQSSDSESNSSDSENEKEVVFGNLDNDHNNANNHFIPSDKPRPSGFHGFGRKTNPEAKTTNNLLQKILPDKEVLASRSFPFRRFILVSSIIASVIALTQIVKNKRKQKEKGSKNPQQTKRQQRETPGGDNRSHV